jgi:hypothetical protein
MGAIAAGCVRHADGSVTHIVLGLGFVTVPGEVRVEGRAGARVAAGGSGAAAADDGRSSPEVIGLWAMEAVGLIATVAPPSPGLFLGYMRGQASAVPVGAEVLTEIRHSPGGPMTLWVRGMASGRNEQLQRGER